MASSKNRSLRSVDIPPVSIPAVAAMVVALLLAGPSIAQTSETTPSPSALKKLSMEELMDMDVTSVSKKPEPYSQAPAAIAVVTGDAIRRSGASSIPEALRLADNLDVAQQNSHDWSISSRGFNAGLANKLLVLMDGRTIYTPLYSGVFWYQKDTLLADLDRIEVVSGPGGTLWGANAVNGVINIVSKGAKDTQGFHVEAGGGTSFQDFAGIRYGGTLDPDVHFRVYGKYFDRGNEAFAAGNDASDAWRMGQGGFRLDLEGGEGAPDKLTLQGDLYDSHLNIPAVNRVNASGGNILARWSRILSDDAGLSLQAYYDRTCLASPTGGYTFKDDLDTVDLDFQHHFSLDGGNRFGWGLAYRFTHDVIGPTPALTFLPPVLDHHLFSCFLQDEVLLLKDFSLILGTKLEHNDYTRFEVEPSARVKWIASDDQTLWAAVSRAVRMPSRIDRDLVAPNSTTPTLTGGRDFKSETLIAYELGYRAQPVAEISVSLSAFYNFYDDLRSIGPVAGVTVIQNGVEGQTYGGELATDYQVFEGWRLHAGYALIKEKMQVKAGQNDVSNALGNTADPENRVFLRSSTDLPEGLALDLAWRWVDKRPIASGGMVGVVPDYLEMDARLGWSPVKNLELSIVGRNLLHDHHPEYGFPTPARVEIKRGVYGKLACQF